MISVFTWTFGTKNRVGSQVCSTLALGDKFRDDETRLLDENMFCMKLLTPSFLNGFCGKICGVTAVTELKSHSRPLLRVIYTTCSISYFLYLFTSTEFITFGLL